MTTPLLEGFAPVVDDGARLLRHAGGLASSQSRRVVLWDVLHKCRRVGSSDAQIYPKSLVIR